MSDEINYVINISCTNGNFVETFSPNGTIDQLAVGANAGVFIVSTTATNLPVGSVVNVGLLLLLSLEDPETSTTYIDYGLDDAGTMKAVGRLLPGEPAVFRVKPGVGVKMLASPAIAKVRFVWLEA